MKLPNLITRTSRTLALLCSGGMLLPSLSAQRIVSTNVPSREAQAIMQELERMPAERFNETSTRPQPASTNASLVGILVDESGPTAVLAQPVPLRQGPNRLEPKCYSLRESETIGQLTALQIDPPNRSVSVRFNGVATHLNLPADSTPALPRTVPRGQFQCALKDAPMGVCVGLYGSLTGRATVSTRAVATNRVTAALSNPVTSAEAADWLRETAFRNGVAILPGGDYFAIVVPAAQTNLAKLIVTAPPTTSAAKELTYAFSEAGGDVVLQEYGALLGRKIEATQDALVAVYGIRCSFLTPRPLSRAEVRSVFETLFRIHSLRTEPVDDTHVRLTRFTSP